MIQVEVSTILQRESQFSIGTMVTVSLVRVTRDLELGKIYVSVFPETNAKDVVKNLNTNGWEIRKMLSARIRNQMRKMPNIIFHLDDSLQEVEKIEKLFENIVIPEATEEETNEESED